MHWHSRPQIRPCEVRSAIKKVNRNGSIYRRIKFLHRPDEFGYRNSKIVQIESGLGENYSQSFKLVDVFYVLLLHGRAEDISDE